MNLDLSKKLDLDKIRGLPNIAELLDESDLLRIGSLVVKGFEEDKRSRYEWEQQVAKALDLAELKMESKNYPFVNSANIKYPLLTTANIQFAARTYPELVRNGKVVEVMAVGKDLDGEKAKRASRISTHMSYQLLIESNEWEEHTDRLLHLLPTVGTCFKKVYYDQIKEMNRSCLCLHDEIIVNDNITSLENAKRITHILFKSKNELVELFRAGLYKEDEQLLIRCSMDDLDDDLCLLEQHRWLDLDKDGYEEPYIVTVDKESNKVLRIVARFDADGIKRNSKDEIMSIKPVHYFVDFHFIPNPSGKYHSIGFGHLLTPLNSAVNTILNQLVDSGTLANIQGGFISSKVRSKEKDIRVKMGEFKVLNTGDANLAQSIYPMQYKEPSNVLFQLLGMLINATKELSSVTEALTGTQPGQNVPATTMLSLVEQGLKVFSSIQRRLYRPLKKEFNMLFRLNRIYLDDAVYMNVMDDEAAVLQSDYEETSIDVRPIADPTLSSDAQRFARSQVLDQMVAEGRVDPIEATRRKLETLDIPNPEALMPKPSNEPSIEMLELQADMAKNAESLRLQEKDLQIRAIDAEVRAARAQAEVSKTLAEATESIARAESLEVGNNIAQYKAELDGMKLAFYNIEKEFNRVISERDMKPQEQAAAMPSEPPLEKEVANDTDIEGPVPGMEAAPDNGSVIPEIGDGEA